MNIDSSLKLYGPSHVQTSSLEKTSKSKEISQVNDEESRLVFSQEIITHRSSLSQSMENINGGILTTLIAQKGLESQGGVLDEIKQELLSFEDEIGLDEKNKIARLINSYEQIAGIVGHNGQTPLKISDDLTENDLSIVSDDEIIEISAVDTLGVSDTLKSYLNTLDNSSIENMLNDIDTGTNILQNFKDEFSDAFKSLNIMAKQFLSEEKGRSNISGIDYSKEVKNFSKENILSRTGSLVAIQANTVQERTLPLVAYR